MHFTVRKDNCRGVCIIGLLASIFIYSENKFVGHKALVWNFIYAIGSSNCGSGNICSRSTVFFCSQFGNVQVKTATNHCKAKETTMVTFVHRVHFWSPMTHCVRWFKMGVSECSRGMGNLGVAALGKTCNCKLQPNRQSRAPI